MNQEKTICYKIDQCFDWINSAKKNGTVNISEISRLLHAVRQDAQRMEEGLRARKTAMENAQIEETYQNVKTQQIVRDGIDKIGDRDEITLDNPLFEFTIKDLSKNEIMLQQKAHAAVLSIVTKMEGMDKDGMILGETFKFYCGHDIAVWFAFDQLRQAIEHKIAITGATLSKVIRTGMLFEGAIQERLQKIFKLANLDKT